MTEQWYNNKELFEQLNDMRIDFRDLRAEMKETRLMMKQYNGLREQIIDIDEKVEATVRQVNDTEKNLENLKATEKGKAKAFDSIIKYGGWIISILMFVAYIFNYFII